MITDYERETGIYITSAGIWTMTEANVKAAVRAAIAVCQIMQQALRAFLTVPVSNGAPRCIVVATLHGVGIFKPHTIAQMYRNMKEGKPVGRVKELVSWADLALDASWDPEHRKGLAALGHLAMVVPPGPSDQVPRGLVRYGNFGYMAGPPHARVFFVSKKLHMGDKYFLATLVCKSLRPQDAPVPLHMAAPPVLPPHARRPLPTPLPTPTPTPPPTPPAQPAKDPLPKPSPTPSPSAVKPGAVKPGVEPIIKKKKSAKPRQKPQKPPSKASVPNFNTFVYGLDALNALDAPPSPAMKKRANSLKNLNAVNLNAFLNNFLQREGKYLLD